jgi:hypothetical protein
VHTCSRWLFILYFDCVILNFVNSKLNATMASNFNSAVISSLNIVYLNTLFRTPQWTLNSVLQINLCKPSDGFSIDERERHPRVYSHSLGSIDWFDGDPCLHQQGTLRKYTLEKCLKSWNELSFRKPGYNYEKLRYNRGHPGHLPWIKFVRYINTFVQYWQRTDYRREPIIAFFVTDYRQ